MTGLQFTRRRLLHAALASAAGASLCGLPPLKAVAQDRRPALKATRLTDTLLMVEGAGGNVVVASGPDGSLMVDGGLAERSAELLRLVAAETQNRPVKTLFNTHWHWDHTGSNEVLADTGTTIIAHENTKLWLGAEIISKWENRTYPPRPLRALPQQTFFYGEKSFPLGNQNVGYALLPQAHTDGDIYVFFPHDNVLVAGDVVSGGSYPILDYSTGGWLGGMLAALKVLIAKADSATRIVPGSGPVRTRSDLEAQREMCLTVLQRIGESYYKGQTWEELVASRPTREFDARWGNPDVFLHTAYEGAWGHITEIRRVTA